MPPRSYFTLSLIVSLALHALAIAALFLIKPALPTSPPITPVTIVNLPQQALKQLPQLNRPVPVPPAPPVPERFVPEKPLPPDAVPVPKSFDKSDILRLPRTSPVPQPDKEMRNKAGNIPENTIPDLGAKKGGPLPFLSQQDINRLARKGYTEDTLHNEMLFQETEAFKLLPYGRWLFASLNKNLRFPELAAVTGLQGDVYITFEINKDGSLGDLYVAHSSGYKILDDEVVRTIRDSAPFRPLPPDLNRERLIVPVVGIFRIYEKNIR